MAHPPDILLGKGYMFSIDQKANGISVVWGEAGEQMTRLSEGMPLAASRALLPRDPQGLSAESSHGIPDSMVD